MLKFCHFDDHSCNNQSQTILLTKSLRSRIISADVAENELAVLLLCQTVVLCITVEGDMNKVTKDKIQNVYLGDLNGGQFTCDINCILMANYQ